MRFSVRVIVFLLSSAFSDRVCLLRPVPLHKRKPPQFPASSPTRKDAVIADAQVSAESIPPAGAPARGVSASDGRFSLTLAPGRYRVTIARDSFATAEQEITIAAGETRELQVRLALEPLSSKVVVTAQALPLDAESSPAPLTILTREQIDQRVATSLPDLLATQPGFSLGAPGRKADELRCFSTAATRITPKCWWTACRSITPGGLIDFSNFTLDNIDKIEIVHGAESALYGRTRWTA